MRTIAILEQQAAGAQKLKEALRSRFPTTRLEIFTHRHLADQAFARAKPHVIISDLVLADGDALWLLQKSKDELKETIFFIVSAFPGWKEIAETFSGQTNLYFFHKLFECEQLLDALDTVLMRTPDSVMRGITLQTVLQMVQLERKSCYLEIASDPGVGYLFFRQGTIFHARLQDLLGEEAFAQLLRHRCNIIRVFEGAFQAEQNLEAPLLKLLLTHSHGEDERQAIEQKVVNYR